MDPFAPLFTLNWTGLIFDIESRLDALACNGGGYLVLNVDRPDDPFVQFVVDRLGSIEAEAASTVVADPETQERQVVDDGTVGRLLRSGWHPPDADPLQLAQPSQHPNFHRAGDVGWPPPLFAELGVRTLVEAFGVTDPSLVRVRGGYLAEGDQPLRA